MSGIAEIDVQVAGFSTTARKLQCNGTPAATWKEAFPLPFRTARSDTRRIIASFLHTIRTANEATVETCERCSIIGPEEDRVKLN